MKAFTIWAHKKGDGLMRLYPYMGETEDVESADYGGGGWHVANHDTRNVIKFGRWGFDSPYEIGGVISLKSHIERICKRLREGAFDDIDELRIKITEE